MNLTNRVMRIALLATLLVPIASPAQAYLDPGTGSMILQGLIGAVVGGLIALKLYWARLKNFITGNRADLPTDDSDNKPDPN